ncbi:MAG: hypothetical protein L0K41_09680 [Yaniella sp.]|uniref:hypothetical protein n=1 Tax=Yaniella sp. TaxID=2773929 RepID=UPI001833FF6A|nr:hypothetical protein [Yaniella sp.]NLZ99279.1 hypothetical protein [Micrococcus sp.]MDN5703961.1 hypothetical protein [Yaniella sp.]MDN5732216.1 hypothetical protein [Yaniella sp.]MDN5742315.1 hypothetical protein [Yaniella sp.]MDN5815168.1 hypothetical protein [Yaniella sp.]
MHKHAPGIKVLWVFTLIVGLLLAGSAVVTIIAEDGVITTQHWMLIGLGSVKIIGACIGLWMFHRAD